MLQLTEERIIQHAICDISTFFAVRIMHRSSPNGDSGGIEKSHSCK